MFSGNVAISSLVEATFIAVEVWCFLCFSVSQVMAIMSLHFVWQRQRSDHHSGAQRQYSDPGQVRFPRGPFASPVSCSLCNRVTRLLHISSSSGAPPQAVDSTYPHLFTSALGLEFTPVRIPASHRNTVKDTSGQHKPCCCCPEEVPSTYHYTGLTLCK